MGLQQLPCYPAAPEGGGLSTDGADGLIGVQGEGPVMGAHEAFLSSKALRYVHTATELQARGEGECRSAPLTEKVLSACLLAIQSPACANPFFRQEK